MRIGLSELRNVETNGHATEIDMGDCIHILTSVIKLQILILL